MTKLLPLFFFLSTTLYSQTDSNDCDKNLDKLPYFVTHSITNSNDSLLNDFKILRECGQLDSLDNALLSGPMLGSIMIAQAPDGKEITYRSILKSINEFKQTDNYKNFRNTQILANKILNLADWENDKQLLESMKMPESEIADLKAFVSLHPEERMTFKEAYTRYLATKPKEEIFEPPRLQFPDLGNLDNAIRTGKEKKKTVLIYFTCYACVNARKMEANILANEEVKSFITDNFVYFSAYVDDKKIDPNTNSTIGNGYLKLQSWKFNMNYQPDFVIIDEQGSVIANIGYTTQIDEFINFLKKGIK